MCDTASDASEMAGLLSEVVQTKKATIVMVFFVYVVYCLVTGAIYFFEYKKNEDMMQKMKAIKQDIEQRQFFILVIALLT